MYPLTLFPLFLCPAGSLLVRHSPVSAELAQACLTRITPSSFAARLQWATKCSRARPQNQEARALYGTKPSSAATLFHMHAPCTPHGCMGGAPAAYRYVSCRLTGARHIHRFNCINENDFSILVKDDDIGSDDFIGKGEGTLAKVRTYGVDRQEVTMISQKTRHQHGFVSISLAFAKNNAMQPPVSLPACLATNATALLGFLAPFPEIIRLVCMKLWEPVLKLNFPCPFSCSRLATSRHQVTEHRPQPTLHPPRVTLPRLTACPHPSRTTLLSSRHTEHPPLMVPRLPTARPHMAPLPRSHTTLLSQDTPPLSRDTLPSRVTHLSPGIRLSPGTHPSPITLAQDISKDI